VKLTQRKKVIIASGLAGLGILALGIWATRQNRVLMGLGRFKQAPVVGTYSDGRMKTILRASNQMPIEQRIATIQDLVHKSVQNAEMRKLALQITNKCPERDQRCEAEAIYHAIKNRVRYTGDIGPIRHPDGKVEGIDLYQSAKRTWEFSGGDCDDHAILGATLLALNGIEPRLRVVRQRKDPDWSHVFCGGMINGRFVPLDTTLPGNRSFDKEGVYVKGVDFKAVDLPA
jgi:transglutaminase-like putative cysteine protease